MEPFYVGWLDSPNNDVKRNWKVLKRLISRNKKSLHKKFTRHHPHTKIWTMLIWCEIYSVHKYCYQLYSCSLLAWYKKSCINGLRVCFKSLLILFYVDCQAYLSGVVLAMCLLKCVWEVCDMLGDKSFIF